MKIRPIHTEKDNEKALKILEKLLDKDPKPGTRDADNLEILSILIEDFESKHYQVRKDI
jgi:HTH-type transcriptional regulator / antitoxin HigA